MTRNFFLSISQLEILFLAVQKGLTGLSACLTAQLPLLGINRARSTSFIPQTLNPFTRPFLPLHLLHIYQAPFPLRHQQWPFKTPLKKSVTSTPSVMLSTKVWVPFPAIAFITHRARSTVNKFKGAVPREWDAASEFDASKDKTQFRRYEEACDRVKNFYREQHGLSVLFCCGF